MTCTEDTEAACLDDLERCRAAVGCGIFGGPLPCAACGHQPSPADPLVLAEGHQVHLSHVRDPADGFYGAVFQSLPQEAS